MSIKERIYLILTGCIKMCLFSVFQWCLSVTQVWERVTCCPVSPEMSLIWRVRAPSELSSPHAASKWTARQWRPRSGIQLARSATVPSHQREYRGGGLRGCGSLQSTDYEFPLTLCIAPAGLLSYAKHRSSSSVEIQSTCCRVPCLISCNSTLIIALSAMCRCTNDSQLD